MKFVNTGKITQVRDGIAFAEGLSNAGYNEKVNIVTENGNVQGLVLNLEENNTGLVVLGDYLKIHEGDVVETTGELLNIKVNENIIGKIVDSLGFSIEGKSSETCPEGKTMPLEITAPGVINRRNVTQPLLTGILGIDAVIPIGRGQRQLVIGDRQTGKTTLCLDTILNQKGKDVVCIYVSIGQKASKLAQLKEKLSNAGAMEYTVIVSANSADPASMQYVAPYAGCAIGEYFANQGKHALVIYDDLTKHAWAYREISLLLRRPPGREAYPGDIFYLHSRLLERSLQFSDEFGGGSLTALPVVETQAGDVSAYVPTNIISITDGQIFLDTELYNSGQLPAINFGTSVSRVGGEAQAKVMKQLAGKLKLELAQYREIQAFAQFGSEMDKETKAKLARGEKIMELLKQPQLSPYQPEHEIVSLYSGISGLWDEIETSKIQETLPRLLTQAQRAFTIVRDVLEKNEKLTDQQLEEIKGELKKYL